MYFCINAFILKWSASLSRRRAPSNDALSLNRSSWTSAPHHLYIDDIIPHTSHTWLLTSVTLISSSTLLLLDSVLVSLCHQLTRSVLMDTGTNTRWPVWLTVDRHRGGQQDEANAVAPRDLSNFTASYSYSVGTLFSSKPDHRLMRQDSIIDHAQQV